MNKLKSMCALIALVGVIFATSGCTSPELAAYKTTATVEKSVDALFGMYIDYKAAHPVPVDIQLKVRSAARAWVDANNAAATAALAYDAEANDPTKSPEAKSAFDAATAAVQASASEITTLINDILYPK